MKNHETNRKKKKKGSRKISLQKLAFMFSDICHMHNSVNLQCNNVAVPDQAVLLLQPPEEDVLALEPLQLPCSMSLVPHTAKVGQK